MFTSNSNPINNDIKFLNPKFKNCKSFVRYCYLYDPAVEIKSARSFEKDTWDLQSDWYKWGFDFLENHRFDDSELKYYYTCASSYWEHHEQYNILTLIEDFQKRYSIRFSNAKEEKNPLFKNLVINSILRDLVADLSQKVRNRTLIDLTKQYIYYKCDDENVDGWMIVVRPKQLRHELLDFPTFGIGKTLQEASIDFAKNQAHDFTVSLVESEIPLTSQEIPLTSQEMLDICSKFDSGINPLSLQSKKVKWLAPAIPVSYYLQCESEDTKFCLYVEDEDIRWKVIKFLDMDEESSNLINRIPIESVHDNIELAFKACEEKFNLLKNNREEFNREVCKFENKILQEQAEFDAREGEEHINWLLSEYGEDVFSDRG